MTIDDFPIEIDNDFLSIPIDCYRFCQSTILIFSDFDFYRFPISNDINRWIKSINIDDIEWFPLSIGGLNRLISMISSDFRYRFLSINYVWSMEEGESLLLMSWPFKHLDQHTNSPDWPPYISWKIGWDNLLKDQSIFSL